MRWALPLLLALGCAATPGEDLVVDVTPPQADATPVQAAEETRDQAFSRCKAELEKTETPTPPEQARNIAVACSTLYSEPACREAWLRGFSDETSPADRVRIVIEGCRAGYCDDLPEAALCKGDWTALSAEERATAWTSFRREILIREIGAERVAEIERIKARAAGSSGEAARPTSPHVVKVFVDARGQTTFDGAQVDEAGMRAAFHRELASDPSVVLEVVAEPNTPMSVTVKILDVATAAGFTRVGISTKQ